MSIHPSINHSEVHTSDRIFTQAVVVVNRSGAAAMIEAWRAESVAAPRGPFRGALSYTVESVLVALACVLLRRAEPTVRTIFRTLLDFTPDQLAQLDIADADLTAIRSDADRALKSFRNRLDRTLACLDSARDQPAVRIPVAQHKAIIRARTPEQQEAYAIAAQRLSTVVNRILAGSIPTEYQQSGRGDVVVDETIIDTSDGTYDLGVTDDRNRSAIYFGGYYRRDYRNRVDAEGNPLTKKRAWGIGVTAVSSVGPPDALHNRPILFTGIAIHPPTSGSLEGLDEAIEHHQRNGFDSRSASRTARWPLITFDMGYLKDGLDRWQFDRKYAGVFRYPDHWRRDFESVPAQPGGAKPGPVQLSGAWYCPTAAGISLGKNYVKPLRDVLNKDEWEARERRLRQLLPRLMGVDRRLLERNTRPGRPAEGTQPAKSVKLVLTCPASIGNVRCARWHNAETEDRLDLPYIEPEPDMPYFPCCTQRSVTITLTDDQRKRQQLSQWAPGSNDHAIYHEAARALTEQRFNLIKSRTVAGLVHLKYGPRREPLVKLIIAMAFAVVNVREIERFESSNRDLPESIAAKWRRLEADLGQPPIRMPNRT
ncbi:hypothetical protein Gbro_0042 [Gordonia bronchialis DSM 43247]|uniref:Uncharacterized protein n=2 Tax=Gordonia bronchialis TaxID=2054 RepID=D0LA71_GORB4|nr:hypothetical protein [Gordonia bronchialis]ACY19400.1 hypothetical protein Gbro_0042 [Gordonia bronchialis DSM 43247]STQ62148.1 Uncharacterised protein [Gordonia bronchialis]